MIVVMSNRLRVALDVSSLNERQVSGVGVYTIELFKALNALDAVEIFPFCRLSRWKHRREMRHHIGSVRPWIPGIGLSVDVIHGPDFRVIKAIGKARVVTIHDLAFLKEGLTSDEFRNKKKADLEALLLSSPPDQIITVSESTKQDLIERYPQFGSITTAIHLGGDHLKSVCLNAEPPKNHFLFVGNLEARKNVLGILRAFELHASGMNSTRLVLVGKPGYQGETILSAVEKSPFAHRIEWVGYCPNDQLENYYRGAIALVYPSIVEGFGIPVLEAMRIGCPVITSASTACAEIVGDRAKLVNPSDTGEIARAMDEMVAMSQSPQRQLWIKSAQERAAQFTWEKCARETVEVYRRASRS